MMRSGSRAVALVFAFAYAVNVPTAHAQDTAAQPVVVSSMGDDGAYAATKDAWYFEQYDERSRPVSGVLWKAGTITERTSWAYRGTGQQATSKIVTSGETSTTYEYDESGNVIVMKVLDAKGIVTDSSENEYDKDGRLVLSIRENGGEITRTEITYENGEQTTKRVFRNGEPTMLWQSTGKNDWTETMYHKGEAILVVEYVDGVRKERP